MSALGLLGFGAVLALGWGPMPGPSFPGGDRLAVWMLRIRLACRLLPPEDRYPLAERLYAEGDFERALLECERVLQRNPRHAPASALHMELRFILGLLPSPAYDARYEKYMTGSMISSPQLRLEIDNALARAERHRVAGDYEGALVEVRKAQEFLKWMPAGPEEESQIEQARLLRFRLESRTRER